MDIETLDLLKALVLLTLGKKDKIKEWNSTGEIIWWTIFYKQFLNYFIVLFSSYCFYLILSYLSKITVLSMRSRSKLTEPLFFYSFW